VNDVLQEFIVESGFGRRFVHPSSPDGRHISIDPDVQKKAQKFSELILKDCMKLVDKASSEKISKHFGIK
jgi:hypothetical protein